MTQQELLEQAPVGRQQFCGSVSARVAALNKSLRSKERLVVESDPTSLLPSPAQQLSCSCSSCTSPEALVTVHRAPCDGLPQTLSTERLRWAPPDSVY